MTIRDGPRKSYDCSRNNPRLEIDLDVLRTSDQWPLDKLATAVVQDTRTDVVIYLPDSLEVSLQTPAAATVQLLSDGTNPVGRQIVSAMLAQVMGLATATQPTATQPRSHPATQRPVRTALGRAVVILSFSAASSCTRFPPGSCSIGRTPSARVASGRSGEHCHDGPLRGE